MTQAINMEVLREVLAGAENMVTYYTRNEEKVRQNEVLRAAGLPPAHSEYNMRWDREMAAKKRREVACLQAVIAFLEGESVQAEAA